MPHLAEGALQAYLDGELSETERSSVRDHLADCPHCRVQLEAARDRSLLFHEVAQRLDVPLPPARPLERAEGAEGGRLRAVPGTAGRDGPGSRPVTEPAAGGIWRALARAAVLLLVTAGVASAVIPGSPVREWLVDLVTEPEAPQAERPAPAAGLDVDAPTAVSVHPEDGRIRISLRDFPARTRVEVALHDRPEAVLEAWGDGAGVRYALGRGRIEATGGAEPARLSIRLPRAAEDATIHVNGELAVIRTGDQFELLRPEVDSLAGGVTIRLGS